MGLKALVVLESKDLLSYTPEIFSIGGFAGVTDDGRAFVFDWCDSTTCCCTEKGKKVFVSELNWFDEEFFQGSNTEVQLEEITPEFLTSCTLTEVSYECYENEITDDIIPLKVSVFEVCDSNNKYSFSDEQLEAYNNNYSIWLINKEQ